MSYKTAFPSFDHEIDTKPLQALGFADSSWCNDACPSFIKQLPNNKECKVYVDYQDKELRDHPEGTQYSVLVQQHDSLTFIADATTFAEALHYIKEAI